MLMRRCHQAMVLWQSHEITNALVIPSDGSLVIPSDGAPAITTDESLAIPSDDVPEIPDADAPVIPDADDRIAPGEDHPATLDDAALGSGWHLCVSLGSWSTLASSPITVCRQGWRWRT